MTVSADELRTIIREELAACGIESANRESKVARIIPTSPRVLLPEVIRRIMREELDLQRHTHGLRNFYKRLLNLD